MFGEEKVLTQSSGKVMLGFRFCFIFSITWWL